MQTLITEKSNVLRCFSKQFHDSIFHYDSYFSKFRREILQKFDETKKHFIEKYTFRNFFFFKIYTTIQQTHE